MKKFTGISFSVILIFYVWLVRKKKDKSVITYSPDKSIQIVVGTEKGFPFYEVLCDNKSIIKKSKLGFEFSNAAPFDDSLEIVNIEQRSFDETWKPLYGTDDNIRNQYNETVLTLKEYSDAGRSIQIIARAYNDGVAFRYVFLGNQSGENLNITQENTMFCFAQNDSAWWIPADEFAYESLYRNNPLSEIKEAATPLTIACKNGLFVSVHEAQLLNYSEMFLSNYDCKSPDFFVSLWPETDRVCARVKTPFKTPWRCLIISRTQGGLIESHLVQNLNEPSKMENTSWIKPLKFVGIWWGLHLGKQTWYEGEKHGATTERTKQYIDFAAANNIGGVLAEGWNQGWETWTSDSIPMQNFCKAYSDFNLEEVVDYCRKNNIQFVSHHETGGNIPEYERQLDSAMALCQKLGIHYLKTGYAGSIIPEGHHHHGQFMVNHFQKVVETAAKYQICLDVHESIKPTGLERTWPNLMTQEAARGNEWNATYKATPPYHATILPFTRLLAGPYDYTPGIFKINHSPEKNKRLYCTRTSQMALFVVFYSPMMMVSDIIENYQNEPEFRFVREVPASWNQTKLIDARLGDYVCIARRSGDNWFLGSVGDENCHLIKIPLNFLEKDQQYVAEIYCDAGDTDWNKNPEKVEIKSYLVSYSDTIYAALSKAGGHTVIIRRIDAIDISLPNIVANNNSALDKMLIFRNQKTYSSGELIHSALNKPVSYTVDFSSKYPASGKFALTDGVRGTFNLNENWQGFEAEDMEVVIDLGETKEISKISAGFLDSPNDWIFYPKQLEFFISIDGKSFVSTSKVPISPTKKENAGITSMQDVDSQFKKSQVRFIKVKAVSIKSCPEWHSAKGKKAWLFCDEIMVE